MKSLVEKSEEKTVEDEYFIIQLQNNKKIIINMNDVLDIILIPYQALKIYSIIFENGERWQAPIDDESIEKFNKIKEKRKNGN